MAIRQAPLSWTQGQDPSLRFVGEMTDAQFASSPTFSLAQGFPQPYSLRNVGQYKGSTAMNLSDWFNARGEARPSISQMGTLWQALGFGNPNDYTGSANQQRQLLGALQVKSGGGSVSVAPSASAVPSQGAGSFTTPQRAARPLGSVTSDEQQQLSSMRNDPRYVGTNDEVLLGIIRGSSSQQQQPQQYGGTIYGQQQSIGDQVNPQDISGLKALGIDTTGWSSQQIGYANMFLQLQKINADKNKPITPLTSDELAKNLEDAKKELGPYYDEIKRFGERDFKQQFSVITGEATAQEAEMARRQQEQLDAEQQRAEAAGLADSGLRQKAEAILQERQKGLVEASRADVQQRLYGLGSNYERRYGTAAFQQAGVPQFQSRTFETPGVAPRQIAYAPEAVPAMGELMKQQEVATRMRAAEMGEAEINRQRAVLGYI